MYLLTGNFLPGGNQALCFIPKPRMHGKWKGVVNGPLVDPMKIYITTFLVNTVNIGTSLSESRVKSVYNQ